MQGGFDTYAIRLSDAHAFNKAIPSAISIRTSEALSPARLVRRIATYSAFTRL